MIQRIQSIYLFLASILLMLTSLFPFYTVKTAANDVSPQAEFANLTLYKIEIGALGLNEIKLTALMVLHYVVAALVMGVIFMYKNRSLQIRLARIGVLFIGTLIFAYGVQAYRISESLKGDVIESSIGLAYAFQAVALLLTAMAWRAIIKDDQLVKSADRIRD